MRMGRRVRMKVSLDQLYLVKLSHVFETVRSRRKKVFFPVFYSKSGKFHTWNIMTLLSSSLSVSLSLLHGSLLSSIHLGSKIGKLQL